MYNVYSNKYKLKLKMHTHKQTMHHQLHLIWHKLGEHHPTYRAVLALHAGAVEAERGDSVADPLDVEDALVASLARLRLGQVPGLQGDGLHLPCWDQNLLGAHQLGTVLEVTGTGQGAHVSADKERELNLFFFFFFGV